MNENVNQEHDMTTQNRDALADARADEKIAKHRAMASQDDDDMDEMDEEASDDDEISSEDFEAMLNESEDRTRMRVDVGQRIEGRIVAISGQVVYVDIGMRSEAALEITEDERFGQLKAGETIAVFVANTSGQVELSLDPIMGKGDISILDAAHSNDTAVEGRVTSLMSGGYEINVAGVRCFCPHSQIGLRGTTDPAAQLGKTLLFKVIDLDLRKKNVVLSRRAILEAERNEKMEETRDRLVVGAVLKGIVRDIQRFGAFVDLGGIQGLLHISQLSYSNVEKVENLLKVGDEVEVKLLEITKDGKGKERLSLSMKALMPNPWESLGLKEGAVVTGTVARKSQFGVFVNLAPAIDGLLPRRMMKKSGQAVEIESYNEGDQVEVEIIEINMNDRKIALALPGWNEESKSSLSAGEVLKAEIVKILPVGILVKGVEDSARGLLHKRHLKHTSMKQIVDAYPIGSVIDVVLQDIDEQGRFNFVLPGDSDSVDEKTINAFSKPGNLGHSPFASFFQDREE